MLDDYGPISKNKVPVIFGASGTAQTGTAEAKVITATESSGKRGLDTYIVGGTINVDVVMGDLINVQEQPYSLRVDDINRAGGTVYIGEGTVGMLDANAVWRIRRLIDTSGTVDIKWADGDSTFNNIWDNRASLSYS